MIQFTVGDSNYVTFHSIKDNTPAYQFISDITQALALAENDGIGNFKLNISLAPANDTITLRFIGENNNAE